MYAGIIIIAANSGGAWSPIGDITTIMLWVKGNVTTTALVKFVLLPSLVSMIVPLIFASRMLGGTLAPIDTSVKTHSDFVSFGEKRLILILGVLGLVFVPLLKLLLLCLLLSVYYFHWVFYGYLPRLCITAR